MTETVKTFCRNCGAICSMEIDVEDGRMVRARPDGSVSPYGGYMCPKGLAAIELHNGMEARLSGSLKRGDNETPILDGKIVGDQITFRTERERDGRKVNMKVNAKIQGDSLKGQVESDWSGEMRKIDWEAARDK